MPLRFDISAKANLESIPKIRDMLGKIMASSWFSQHEILEAQLALEEACANIALYAYPSGVGTIRISFEIEEASLIIEIEDCGVPFDITCHETELPSGEAKERPIGGLGIYLIKRLMNDISYHRKGAKNILRLIKTHNI